jgi:hypothetical protein
MQRIDIAGVVQLQSMAKRLDIGRQPAGAYSHRIASVTRSMLLLRVGLK